MREFPDQFVDAGDFEAGLAASKAKWAWLEEAIQSEEPDVYDITRKLSDDCGICNAMYGLSCKECPLSIVYNKDLLITTKGCVDGDTPFSDSLRALWLYEDNPSPRNKEALLAEIKKMQEALEKASQYLPAK